MYNAQVNQHTFSIDVKQGTLNEAHAKWGIETLADGGVMLKLNNKQVLADIVNVDKQQKTVTLRVLSQKVTIQLKEPVDLLLEQLGMQQNKVKKINQLKAPMPGLVVRILVEEGQAVKVGEPLLILEAMKMENCFLSPRDGVIKSIAVEKGNAVDKGQLLIEFE